MTIKKRVAYSIIFALVIFFISMFARVIPCQTAPVVLNPQYQWTFCNLNPDSNLQVGISRKYFGYSSGLTEAYFITIILSFVLAMMVLHFARTRKKD